MAKQEQKRTYQTDKQPTLLKYLITNIQKGNLPSKEELDEIQKEIGNKWLADVNVALLDYITQGHVKPKQVQNTQPAQAKTPNVQQQPQQSKPKYDPNKTITPAQLSSGRGSVLRG